MASLGAIICQAIVHHYGRDEFLRRLSHPFWFQSFGAVMGMDWHSSGITTSVIGALEARLGTACKTNSASMCAAVAASIPDAHQTSSAALGDRVGIDAAGAHAGKPLGREG